MQTNRPSMVKSDKKRPQTSAPAALHGHAAVRSVRIGLPPPITTSSLAFIIPSRLSGTHLPWAALKLLRAVSSSHGQHRALVSALRAELVCTAPFDEGGRKQQAKQR